MFEFSCVLPSLIPIRDPAPLRILVPISDITLDAVFLLLRCPEKL